MNSYNKSKKLEKFYLLTHLISIQVAWSYCRVPSKSGVSWFGSTTLNKASMLIKLVCKKKNIINILGQFNWLSNTGFWRTEYKNYISITSNLYFWLPILVLCFCQKLSGLMRWAVCIAFGKYSCSTFNIGFTVDQAEPDPPLMSMITVNPRSLTSSLKNKNEYINYCNKTLFNPKNIVIFKWNYYIIAFFMLMLKYNVFWFILSKMNHNVNTKCFPNSSSILSCQNHKSEWSTLFLFCNKLVWKSDCHAEDTTIFITWHVSI